MRLGVKSLSVFLWNRNTDSDVRVCLRKLGGVLTRLVSASKHSHTLNRCCTSDPSRAAFPDIFNFRFITVVVPP